MSTEKLEQRLELAARQLGGSVRRKGEGHYVLRIGYPFALNPNDVLALFRVRAEPASSTTNPVAVELLSRPLSPRRRRICTERLSELREFLAATPEHTPAPLKRLPAVRLWGVYNLFVTISSFVVSGTLVALAAGVWLWLLGTQQVLAVADLPHRTSLFFGEPSPGVDISSPTVEVTPLDALGGAVLLAASVVVPLTLVLCCIFLILELLPRSMTSFVLILLLWGVYFVWFFSAWQYSIAGVVVVITLPLASLIAYRLGWELRG